MTSFILFFLESEVPPCQADHHAYISPRQEGRHCRPRRHDAQQGQAVCRLEGAANHSRARRFQAQVDEARASR